MAQQQADFLASVTSSGGSIVMDYEDDGRPAPRMPLWLRGLWGDWPYAHVVKVKISNLDQLALSVNSPNCASWIVLLRQISLMN